MPAVVDGRYTTQIGWRDVPHLSRSAKEDMRRATPPYLRGARERGEPVLGRGRIYDIDVEELSYDPFKLPASWPRVYGLDIGWQRTAALWGAIDRDSDTLYLYSEYYMGQKAPLLHTEAIRARGSWVPGVIDPSARNRGPRDGETMLDLYRREGLNLYPAENAVNAGIDACYMRMTGGRLKVARSLQNFRFEFSIYRRDEKGKVVKKADHLLDCLRYIELSGFAVARTQREATAKRHFGAGGRYVADEVAGY